MQKILFTTSQTCDALSMSRSRLYQEMEAGRLKWVRNGRRRFITAAEIERYVSALQA